MELNIKESKKMFAMTSKIRVRGEEHVKILQRLRNSNNADTNA
jgi:hypothetical protein